ncbi:ubiquitin carboxyl-terminal hydrolase 16 isoform X2 [Rhineura floridana]|uniref:ubiquitin carboxyl-terminal hydrolase 16 isoform X2 n=1 Tax=Rhineura floridana TaxID=261503 RepID=UPI002AC7FF85|nr:ubiquitin carboxyl-terminal hydrolase 16 isoform X2 [Rhineura floridana]
MGKKRTKGKNIPLDDSSDVPEHVCKHLRKGLEQGHLKKVLQNIDWNSCQDCRTPDSETHEKTEEEAEDRPSIWLCLKCGHTGCGRNSQEQHALKHYETPRSEPHCLVLSLDNWSVWCYLCDNEVPYNSSTQLGQVVDYVRKQARVNIENTALKDEENKLLENKKIKDHQNEEVKEKKEILKDNKLHLNGNAEVMVKGLSNLGNTCFFNAVLQNLSQTPILRELLKEVKMPDTTVTVEPPDFSITEPLILTLDQPRPLTLAMCRFLTEMQETKRGTVTPKELFAQVCKKAIRFKGYQQQDSQELLRYLLDGMRTEEIQRISAGIFKALNNSTDKENEELKKKIKEYEKRKVTQSFVDRIFGGELTSTIMCEECQTISLVHESFLDLSLPVLNDQGGKKKTNDNNVRKIQEKEMDDDDDYTGNDCYLKEREETPSTSKHLQKKAKKMAKKQSKNQRCQQKNQEKVIRLTDICATEKTGFDHDCSSETIENNSEGTTLKLKESCNPCEEHCVDQKDSMKEGTTEIDNTEKQDENTENSDREANNETTLDISTEGLVSAVQCVSKCDHLSVKQDSLDEDEDITNSFNKLSLDEEPGDDIDSLNELHHSETTMYKVVNEDPETAFCTLANREAMNREEGSVLHCLHQFTHNEKLCENNKLLCDVCTRRQLCGAKTSGKNAKKHVYTNAKKQMLISLAPPILTLHLKRFQQTGYNLQKVNKHIKFLEVMDLAPFCSVKCKNIAEGSSRVLYSLYGIVEHSGTMRSGHYTAYVKTRATNNQLSDLVLHGKIQQTSETESPKGQWFHVSDTHVQAVPVAKVLNSQAYLLFYERLL